MHCMLDSDNGDGVGWVERRPFEGCTLDYHLQGISAKDGRRRTWAYSEVNISLSEVKRKAQVLHNQIEKFAAQSRVS